MIIQLNTWENNFSWEFTPRLRRWGFWSTAAAVNVHHIALNLLRLVDRQPADLLCVWARRNIRSSKRLPEYVKFIDALTNEELQPPLHGVRVTGNHKDLHYVYNRFPKLCSNYITLVDNLPDHAIGNPSKGFLWIPAFTFLNVNDSVLDKLLRHLQRLWRVRCKDKNTHKKLTKGNTKNTTKGDATKTTKANQTTKSALPPILVNADDLRACLHDVSFTNNGELFPGGYVTNSANRTYTVTSKQLRCYQPVILSVNGRYQRGSVRKIDRAKDTAIVRIMRPLTRPPDVAYTPEVQSEETIGTRKKPVQKTKNTQRHRMKVMKPTYEEIVVPVSALVDSTEMEWMVLFWGECSREDWKYVTVLHNNENKVEQERDKK